MSLISFIPETAGHPEDYTVRTVNYGYSIANESGYEYPCDISYEIIEETKEVNELAVSFHWGYSNPKDGFKYVEEIAREIVETLEGPVCFIYKKFIVQ